MKQLLFLFLYFGALISFAQDNYIFETKFRNPVDTTTFYKSPTMLLFVHSKCKHGHRCPTSIMQQALQKDSLGLREKYGIKLYVVYSRYSEKDIEYFESLPSKNTAVIFLTGMDANSPYKKIMTTPHIIFFDSHGGIHTKTGGTYSELIDSLENNWLKHVEVCPVCNGTGQVKPVRYSSDPDLCVGICGRCRGSGRF